VIVGEVRCRVRGCGALLAAIDSDLPWTPAVASRSIGPPPLGAQYLRVIPCARHGGVDYLLQRARRDQEAELTLTLRVPVCDLRDAIRRGTPLFV
jgi:hypothetical protein